MIRVITVVKMFWSQEAQPSGSTLNILSTVMKRIVVDKRTENASPHSICFLPQYQHQRKCFVFRARAKKGIARHIDAMDVRWV